MHYFLTCSLYLNQFYACCITYQLTPPCLERNYLRNRNTTPQMARPDGSFNVFFFFSRRAFVFTFVSRSLLIDLKQNDKAKMMATAKRGERSFFFFSSLPSYISDSDGYIRVSMATRPYKYWSTRGRCAVAGRKTWKKLFEYPPVAFWFPLAWFTSFTGTIGEPILQDPLYTFSLSFQQKKNEKVVKKKSSSPSCCSLPAIPADSFISLPWTDGINLFKPLKFY